MVKQGCVQLYVNVPVIYSDEPYQEKNNNSVDMCIKSNGCNDSNKDIAVSPVKHLFIHYYEPVLEALCATAD